jgi:hypothetical protein
MANLVMPYLIKVEVHVTEEIYEQDYPSNLQANKYVLMYGVQQIKRGI